MDAPFKTPLNHLLGALCFQALETLLGVLDKNTLFMKLVDERLRAPDWVIEFPGNGFHRSKNQTMHHRHERGLLYPYGIGGDGAENSFQIGHSATLSAMRQQRTTLSALIWRTTKRLVGWSFTSA